MKLQQNDKLNSEDIDFILFARVNPYPDVKIW